MPKRTSRTSSVPDFSEWNMPLSQEEQDACDEFRVAVERLARFGHVIGVLTPFDAHVAAGGLSVARARQFTCDNADVLREHAMEGESARDLIAELLSEQGLLP